ncbi:MAG: Hsp20/alpha crystallin family protein [Fusicatenibacter sp.]|nr:Hsp20/alpha crystallin family protein [Fusicatenibacter sp.]
MLMPGILGETLFDDLMDFSFPDVNRTSYNKQSKNYMKTDIREMADSYELVIDLPGFQKDEIQIQLKDGYLTIHAEKKSEKASDNNNKKYIRRERYTGSMSRSFHVGNTLTPKEIHAKFEDGTLKLDLPKEEKRIAEQTHYISIL